MTVVIQLKRGSGVPGVALADGEPAWDHTNHVLYVGTVGGTNFVVGGTPFTAEDAQDAVGAMLANSARVTLTYADATPSLTADLVADSVTAGYLHASATDVLFGRSSAGAGAGQEVACTAFARTILDDTTAAAVRSTIGAGTSSFGGAFSDLSGVPTTLAGYGITDAQPLDATLTALAGLSVPGGNLMIVSTTVDSFVMLSIGTNTFPARSSSGNVAAKAVTDFALTVLDDADASTARTTLGVAVGTDVQAHDATLDALAALTVAANSLTVGTGADAFSQTTFAANTFPARASSGNLVARTITDFGLSLVDDADAATARATLGATTVGGNLFTLTNPSAITFIRLNADNSVSALDAATFRTAIGAGTGSGTVTSVSGTANQVAVATGTTTPVISLAGPHNFTTQTSHGVLIGAGTGALTATAAMSDGQLLVGQTGADPLPKTMSGDATLAASGALTLANSGASAGTYTNATVAVDVKGRVTSISSGVAGGAGANLYLHHALG